MKSFWLYSSIFVLMLSVASCGKKAEVKDNAKNMEPSVGELNFFALQEIKQAISTNNLPKLKRMVQENPGIDLNQILNDGETFLNLAIKNNFLSIRNYLLDQGVDFEKANINRETPLMVAVAHGHLNSVKVLIDLKVDIEKLNSNGNSALHIALQNDQDEIACFLIKQGANLEATDHKEQNALAIASEHNVPKSLALLKTILKVEFGAPDTATFIEIINQADVKRLNLILTRYPSLVIDYEALNPLALLVDVKDRTSALKTAELLISKSANINGAKAADPTPLIKATLSQALEFAQLYLKANANPQLADKDGKSALVHAIELNNPELVSLLLAHSAPIKYTYRSKGKKISFDACSIAFAQQKKLIKVEEKIASEMILSSLECRFFNWP